MTDLALEYAIQREIDRRLDDDIFPHLENLIQQLLDRKGSISNSQLANLQNVARDTTSIRVILTWIQYQMGRKSNDWDKEFGKALLGYLGLGLSRIAQDITTKLVNGNDEMQRKYIQLIHLRLIRQYVGQLRRVYIGYTGDKS